MRNHLNLALIAALGFAGAIHAQVGLGLSPMRLEFALSAGAVHSGPLALSNESETVVRVRAELLDFYIDDQETPQFAPSYPSESEDSCRKWVTVNPMETEVGPGKSVQVRYTLRVPPDTPIRSFHCAVGFTTLPAAEQLNGMGLRTAVRLISAFYAVVGRPAIEGDVTSMTLESLKTAEGSRWVATVILRNAGDNHFRPVGELAILDEQGSLVETMSFPALPVLPRREQRFRFRLKSDLTRQKYTLRARLDLGAAEVLETTAVVTPPDPGR
jgi:hypothetical protein